MRRVSQLVVFAGLAALVSAGGFLVSRTDAQVATPEPGAEGTSLILVEHAERVTDVDLGETGPSIGDMIVWGPNALYDETNATDTGAVTQGSCVAFDTESNCVGTETIVFADGSTLHFQGVERGGGEPSLRTIVGGSGRYLGATGTMSVEPSADLTLWTKSIAFAAPVASP